MVSIQHQPNLTRVHVSAVALDLEAISMLCIIIWGMSNEACDTNWVLCVRYRHLEYTDIGSAVFQHGLIHSGCNTFMCVNNEHAHLYSMAIYSLDSVQEMIALHQTICKDLAGILIA